jgi:hypothetical protein
MQQVDPISTQTAFGAVGHLLTPPPIYVDARPGTKVPPDFQGSNKMDPMPSGRQMEATPDQVKSITADQIRALASHCNLPYDAAEKQLD